jgi:hypothetical protein
MQSGQSAYPGSGKNAGKNKKKRANKKRRAAANSGTFGTMMSQLGALVTMK